MRHIGAANPGRDGSSSACWRLRDFRVRHGAFENRGELRHAFDELHGFLAIGIAALHARMPVRIREARQVGAHVRPAVRILLAHLRDDARVLEMADADVVRGHRQPGAIRVADALRNALLHVREVARAGEDVLVG